MGGLVHWFGASLPALGSLSAFPPQPWAQDALTSVHSPKLVAGVRWQDQTRAGGTARTGSNFGGSQTSLSTGKGERASTPPPD